MTVQRRVVLFVSGACAGAAGTALFYRWRTRHGARQQPQPGGATSPVPSRLPQPGAPAPAPPLVPDARPATPASVELSRQVLKYGFPGPIHDIRYRDAYISAYDRERRNPSWVAERITREALQRNDDADRARSQFVEDVSIPEKFRASLRDYHRSGYDRGHLVPAADAKITQQAMDETFILTNISPQVGKGFNRDFWAYFENFTRSLVQTFSEVYVFTGPLYLPDPNTKEVRYRTIGAGDPASMVAVPTHFYKVILGVGGRGEPQAIGGFVVPNAPIKDGAPLDAFAVDIDYIERASGLEFFDRVDKKSTVQLCKKVKCVAMPTKHHIKQLEAAAADQAAKSLPKTFEVKALPPPAE